MFREIRTYERISETDRKRKELEREHSRLLMKMADCLIGTESFMRARENLRRFEELHPGIGF